MKTLLIENLNENNKWVKFDEGVLSDKKTISLSFSDIANVEKQMINLVVRVGMYKDNKLFGYAPEFKFMKVDASFYSETSYVYTLPSKANGYTLEYMKNYGDNITKVLIEYELK